jgi:ATP-dependent Lon protease
MTREKDLIKEHFDLVEKREKALDMPLNSLTESYIQSLGKSEIEKRLEKKYKNFTLSQFLNHISKDDTKDI